MRCTISLERAILQQGCSQRKRDLMSPEFLNTLRGNPQPKPVSPTNRMVAPVPHIPGRPRYSAGTAVQPFRPGQYALTKQAIPGHPAQQAVKPASLVSAQAPSPFRPAAARIAQQKPDDDRPRAVATAPGPTASIVFLARSESHRCPIQTPRSSFHHPAIDGLDSVARPCESGHLDRDQGDHRRSGRGQWP
jgi:hypothetical protein